MEDKSIRYYRRKNNITQQKLAELLGITQTYISFIEQKKMYPDIETAEKLASILNVPVGALWNTYELDMMLEKSKI
ncbi:MAG: helix-turn-helix transcriptional regulator [Methanofastidiosum sp.]|jgi:transcriptional regulator with XRE-family HTH domain|nr:helix-turn-helix transcriptional regulator [Defluviitaleaceae bacterium]